MNIFYTDKCPIQSAQNQCDKHVVKMILESAQMLSTVHHQYNSKLKDIYRPTHTKHPSTIWASESKQNYEWLYKHFVALCDEYTHRYNKHHLTDIKLRDVLKHIPKDIPDVGMTKVRLAITDKMFHKKCPIKSYRKYYISKQFNFNMVWTKRTKPRWFKYVV
jgi:hypothetical protein